MHLACPFLWLETSKFEGKLNAASCYVKTNQMKEIQRDANICRVLKLCVANLTSLVSYGSVDIFLYACKLSEAMIFIIIYN